MNKAFGRLGFLKFIVAAFLFVCFRAGAQECQPDWGDWGYDVYPTLSDSCPAVADQCVSVTAVGAYGGPVTASVTVTPTDGTEIRYDYNGCEDPNYQTAPCSLSSPTTTWTASGCGASPASGSGATASFKVNAAGSVTVTFSTTATDCFGAPYSASDSVTFNVHLNDPVCTPPSPPALSTVQLAAPGCTNNGYVNKIYNFAYNVDYYFSGCWGPVTATQTYESPKPVVGDCGHDISGSVDLPSWKVDGEFGLPLGDIADIGISVEYSGLEYHPNVFTDSTDIPYMKWSGNIYLRRTTPNSCNFTGDVQEYDNTYEGDGLWTRTGPDDHSYPAPGSQVSFLAAGQGYYDDFATWTDCKDICCPTF